MGRSVQDAQIQPAPTRAGRSLARPRVKRNETGNEIPERRAKREARGGRGALMAEGGGAARAFLTPGRGSRAGGSGRSGGGVVWHLT